jgi:hypothetical protein
LLTEGLFSYKRYEKNKRPIRQYAWIDDLLYRGIIFGRKGLYIVENISALQHSSI